MGSYKDIQRETGLSLSTISKYFNGGNLREANRAAIEASVEALNFRPNAFAAGLRNQRSRIVGVLLPALNNGFHLNIIAGVEEALRAKGMSVIVASSPAPEDDAVELLLSRMVDGIIAVPSPHDVAALQEATKRIPVVMIDWEAPLDADGVFLDNYQAGVIAARHLLDHGHRRLGLIGGDRSISTMRLRADGFLAEQEAGDGRHPEVAVTEGPLDVETGHAAALHLLGARKRPTALFGANYELTLGALIAVNESGLRLGDDISVIGFDLVEVAQTTIPRLTIIEQPTRAIATQAAELIERRLNEDYQPGSDRVTRLLPPRMLPGGSVSRLHARRELIN
jgi:LacI family transcriptional regulator